MIDINPFKGFFSSLSQISRLNFEICNGKGFIFSSGADRTKIPDAEEIHDLSALIMGRETFQHTFCEGKYALFGVPLKNGDETIGSLIAHGPEDEKSFQPKGISFSRRFQAKEMELFLTYLAGIMEERWISQKETEEMAEELAQSFADLHLYSRVATQIRTLKFSGSMLEDLIEDLLETMRVDLSFSELPQRQEYNVVAIKPAISHKVPDQKALIDLLIKSIPQNAFSSEEHYFMVSDSRETPGYGGLHPDPYRFLAVKMQHNDALYGWLGMVSFNLKEIFRRSELSLMSMMAEQIAVVIANTELYRDLERFVINVVRSLVYTIEAKDVYTRGHSERVNRFCMMMAERLKMEEKQKDILHWASILHDIGKISIPEAILNKPGRLNDEEYNVIKNHPKKGWDILEPIEQLRSSLPAILHHHERYDGRGYPQGLEGEEIPLLGRIISVADTFDAMTSDRAYRSSKTPEKALAIMEEVAGTQLDSYLVEIFKELYIKEIDPAEKENHGKRQSH